MLEPMACTQSELPAVADSDCADSPLDLATAGNRPHGATSAVHSACQPGRDLGRWELEVDTIK